MLETKTQVDGLVELHRHFNENDTVLQQALRRMEDACVIIHPLHIQKLRVPHEPFGLSEAHLAELPDEIRQRLFFFKRLLPNLEIEIEHTIFALRNGRYGEAKKLIRMLCGKNSYMLREIVITYVIIRNAVAADAVTLDDETTEQAESEICARYPRTIDKVSPKPLFFLDPRHDPALVLP